MATIDADCYVVYNGHKSKTYLDGTGNVITVNVSNGTTTTIITTPSGTTTVNNVEVFDGLTGDMRVGTFDTRNYYTGREQEELFVNMGQMAGIVLGEAVIIGLLGVITNIFAGWILDSKEVPKGVVLFPSARTVLGGEDRESPLYNSSRTVSVQQTNNRSTGNITLRFNMIRGDKGKPGSCQNNQR